jgi:hypothetical protein
MDGGVLPPSIGDGKWVIAFDWKGDEIRPGWINWQMVASVDG